MSDIEKVNPSSMDIAEDKRRQLKQIFPEVFREKKIDFDHLKRALGEWVETGRERYGMNWAGKADCIKIIQQPSVGTLKPCREESVNFDETENLFIEGDNLEVLKLLQKAYYGKVKMICVDPPYNTGNDFIYPDNYSESLDTYLKYTGQVDSEGRKYSTNTEADGRFHTKWINMMYPRLYLARNLLSEDGVIFIHIDDNEVTNLRKVCDEIFGEENFVAQIIVQSNPRGRQAEKFVATVHEYVLIYAKNIGLCSFSGSALTDEQLKDFKYEDEKGKKYRLLGLRQRGSASLREDRPFMFYEIFVNPNTGEISLEKTKQYSIAVLPKKSDGREGRWMWSKNKVATNINRVETKLISTRNEWDIFVRDYLQTDNGEERFRKAKTIWDDKKLNYQYGTQEVKKLFGLSAMDFPKPTALLKQIIEMSSGEEDSILDFFSGSSTTADAVLEQNKQDGGNRKFIMVQLPEPCDEKSEAFKAGYKTIADIGKERIRRVIKKIQEEKEGKLGYDESRQDLGFKVFKLHKSNFKIWDGTKPAVDAERLAEQLELHVDHINPQSAQEDILYELLLKAGFDLTTKIEKINIIPSAPPLEKRGKGGFEVFSISDGALIVCLEKQLTKELIKKIADKKPVQVILLDEGFKGNDQLKTNTVQIMKSKKVNTFLTV